MRPPELCAAGRAGARWLIRLDHAPSENHLTPLRGFEGRGGRHPVDILTVESEPHLGHRGFAISRSYPWGLTTPQRPQWDPTEDNRRHREHRSFNSSVGRQTMFQLASRVVSMRIPSVRQHYRSYSQAMGLFEPIFAALEAAQVRYVAVGGVAVVLRGHARLTADLDLAVDLEHEAALSAIETLTSIGFVPRLPVDVSGFADAEVRRTWVEDKGMTVFSLWDPDDPTRAVDLSVVEPIAFGELWQRSDLVDLETTKARVASISDLISMKTISGRPLDLDDIEALTAILERGGPSD